MKMWKKAASVMLASAMVVSLAACGSSGNSGKSDSGSSDADTFKIGGIGPTTGDAAIYGTAVKNGIQLAVDEINAAGGIRRSGRFREICERLQYSERLGNAGTDRNNNFYTLYSSC